MYLIGLPKDFIRHGPKYIALVEKQYNASSSISEFEDIPSNQNVLASRKVLSSTELIS
jgi:hypothetical protein